MSEEGVNRAELIEARERLIAQLEQIRRPFLARDSNPKLVAKLQTMLDEINDLLTADGDSP